MAKDQTNPDMSVGTNPFDEGSDLAGLVESVPAIVYVAEMGRIAKWHYVSGQIEQILGYTPEEWMADPANWFESIHPDDQEGATDYEDEQFVDSVTIPAAEYRMRTKAGDYIWIYERANLIRAEDGTPVWHGVIQDITDLKKAEQVQKILADKHELTSRLGALAMSGVSTDLLFRETAEALVSLPGIHNVSVRELADEGDELHMLASAVAPGHTHKPVEVIPYDPHVPPGSTLLAGETIWVEDWGDDGPLAPFRQFLASDEVRSTFVVPIESHTRQFGVLMLNSDEPNHFSESDNYFLRAVANVLSSAIERSRADQATLHRLHHDPLTELPNRQLFTERINRAIEDAIRYDSTVAVLFLDLDHFKLINDGIGHHAGDELLREVAPRLSAGVRQRDTVARFGGDEFGIVLNGVNDLSDAQEIADRVLASLNEPIVIDQSQHFVTASLGISLYRPSREPRRSAESLIQEADAAMYQAKDFGRSQSQAFDQHMQDSALMRLETERDLRGAIERGELVLHYQPTISLESGKIRGFEALVRWNHPTRGLLGPLEFIAIAEESELIATIDTWVLEEACRQNGIWNREARPGYSYTIAVNTSARQIRSRGLPGLVHRNLEKHGLQPGQLALEITESVLIVGTSTVRRNLAELHDLGVVLSLDDFGTGFSALSYLSEFPFDSIKIDRSFVEQLGLGQPEGSAITQAILNVGEALSLMTVAEAVNTPAQLQMLRDLGCQFCQGFLVSPPMPADKITEMLADPGHSYLPGSIARIQSP